MTGIGHNSGRGGMSGRSWRTYSWGRARASLLRRLPVEVVRLRVRRAAELGLPYRTYAGLRAASGHDLIGFLFSSNALGILQPGDEVPELQATKLVGLRAVCRIALAHSPLLPADLEASKVIDLARRAPAFSASWTETRDHLKAVAREAGSPADRMVVIGATAVEREWSATMQAAGYLSAETFFEPS